MMGLVQRRPFRGPWDKYPLPVFGEGETNGANLKQLSRYVMLSKIKHVRHLVVLDISVRYIFILFHVFLYKMMKHLVSSRHVKLAERFYYSKQHNT